MNTKIALSALGLAMVIVTPAFAQKPTHRVSPAAYASATEPHLTGGRVIGTDPDPSIRFELERDAPTYTSGN